ncbi:DUF6087 family protein [Streptomyces sp. NPDC005486]|uniref:DUF6087 family protein n=1 Tax=Streptomyces sp. NPDC005486 TaxID=3155345 RepID=UPI0033A600D6
MALALARGTAAASARTLLAGVLEWDGHQWIPAGVAEDHVRGARESGPQDAAERVPLPRFSALPPGAERPFRPAQDFRRP